jgi:hypothetical protein
MLIELLRGGKSADRLAAVIMLSAAEGSGLSADAWDPELLEVACAVNDSTLLEAASNLDYSLYLAATRRPDEAEIRLTRAFEISEGHVRDQSFLRTQIMLSWAQHLARRNSDEASQVLQRTPFPERFPDYHS